MAAVTSADGTPIAFDALGEGPPVIVVSGMFCTRATTRELAEQLAAHGFRVTNYDRRGRGASGDTPPYAVAREVEDLAALVEEAGGAAAVYGHSSGAGLALEAAAAGVPITRMVLHEPPYGDDDEESRAASRRLAADVDAALAEGRRLDAVALFFAPMGMEADPALEAVAPTMAHDLAVMGDGGVPEERARAVTAPTLVLAGRASPPFFLEAATRLAELVPAATLTVLDGQDHGAPAEVVAPVVAAFLSS